MNFGCEILSEYPGIHCLTLSTVSLFMRDSVGYVPYWAIALLLIVSLLYVGFRNEQKHDLRWIAGLVALLILWGRIPYWSLPELNPDEGFATSAALALQRDPVFWRSMVGVTHGPLLHYVLLIPSWFGFAIDFASIRAVGAALLIIGVVSTFFASAILFGKRAATFGVIPITLFLGFNSFWDFQAYNGELMVVAWVGILLYCTCRIYSREMTHPSAAFAVLGFLLGLIPLIKLQGAPIGVVIGLAGFYLAWKKYPTKQALSLMIIQGAAAICPLGITFLAAAYFHVTEELLNSSVYFIFYYSDRSPTTFIEKVYAILSMLELTADSKLLLYNPLLASIIVTLIARTFSQKVFSNNRFPSYFVLSVVLSTAYSIIKPGNSFHHYALLLVGATILFVSFSFYVLNQSIEMLPDEMRKRISRLHTLIVLVVVFLIMPLSSFIPSSEPLFPGTPNPRVDPSWTITLRGIAAVTDAKDSMLVWGWADYFYGRAGIPPVMKYPNIFLIVEPSSLREVFAKYYFTLAAEKLPPVIVEAVGKGFFGYNNRDQYGIMEYAQMKKILQDQYLLWGKEGEARIYVRKNRLQRIYGFTDNLRMVTSIVEELIAQSDKPFVTTLRDRLRKASPELTFRQFDSLIEDMILNNEIRTHEAINLRGRVLLKLRASLAPECVVDLAKCESSQLTKNGNAAH